jgi:uncharacterized membrane protein/glutaredoxin
VFLNVAGLLLSIQLLVNHFSGVDPTFCEFGAHVSCMSVQRSPWGFVLGVPLAYFGCVYFVLGLCLSIFLASPRTDDREIAAGSYVLVLIGLLSVAYFVFGEYQLGVICPFCTLVHLLIFATLYFARKVCLLRFPTFSLTPIALLRLVWDLRVWVLIGILLVGLPVISLYVINAPAPSPYSDEQLEQFGKCLTLRRATMYSKPDCPYCTKQKVMLGAGMKHIQLVECVQENDCSDVKIYAFPTWIKMPRSAYEEEIRKGGMQSIEKLAALTRCTITKLK